MLVTKTAITVTNISKLSPTHFVSQIRHQHRCSHFSRTKFTFWLKVVSLLLFRNISLRFSPKASSSVFWFKRFYFNKIRIILIEFQKYFPNLSYFCNQIITKIHFWIIEKYIFWKLLNFIIGEINCFNFAFDRLKGASIWVWNSRLRTHLELSIQP